MTRWIYIGIAYLVIGEAFVFLYLKPEKARWDSSELLTLDSAEAATNPAVGYRLVEQRDRLEAVEYPQLEQNRVLWTFAFSS